MTAVLEIRDLEVAYDGVRIVRGVDLTVGAARKIGIVGESGCGKSTLALAVLGLLGRTGTVPAGSITVLGRDLVGLSQRELDGVRGRDLSLVFQDPLTSLDPVKTVGSQLGEVLRRHGMRGRDAIRRRSVELLASVGVADPAARLSLYPHEFSGGMRQRVLIAIAIANRPAIVVADEPTTALDVTTQAQVLELLDSLVRDLGISVVLITHDLGVVAEFCDEMHVMYAGRIVESGPTAALLASPAHPYTRALLASLPTPGRSRIEPLAWIPGAPPAPDALPPGCSFAPRCQVAIAACHSTTPGPVRLPGDVDRVAECLLVARAPEAADGGKRG